MELKKKELSYYKECKKNGIKPIIGCEVYVAPRSRFQKESGIDDDYAHLILLAKNNEGYKNLIKLVINNIFCRYLFFLYLTYIL